MNRMTKSWSELNKHEKAEILSGLSYLIVFFGACYHVVTQGDIIAGIVMTFGTILMIYYGVEHLKAKRREMNVRCRKGLTKRG